MSDPLGGLEPAPPPREEPRPTPPRRRTPSTYALLLVFAAFFAAEGIIGKDASVESGAALIRLGALYAPALRDGDWWRLGSYAFLHIGWAHILANSWSLWVLAPQLELTFGSNLTLGLFAATAVAGGAGSAFWSLHQGTAVLAAGASGGVLGLFGATAALYWRMRHRLPQDVQRRIVRAIGLNVLLIFAIAYAAPVDNAAHAGGAISGLLLGLIAPLPMLERRPWHTVAQAVLIAGALALAAMEGAAVAWAVHPRPRTLRGAGVEAQVPGMLVPLQPGLAGIPGEVLLEISRIDNPLQIEPGEDAVRIADRTWLRQRGPGNKGEVTRLAASDGGGELVVEMWCGADVCRGAAGERIYEQVARTARSVR
ncbi:MAG: rhomboid family intramembrane serine protease [Deltaproteobacteria bacterium]|nr:MAG: rhomboid family intramembrane serine protease [Deltaproteobacteria bacterium]